MEYRDQINQASGKTSDSMHMKGFHDDDHFMKAIASDYLANPAQNEKFRQIWNRNRKLARIALIHTELSEMVEGIRKDAMDDKLPHRKMEEVELADVLIRMEDYAGFYDLDLGGARDEKEAMNLGRSYKHGKLI